MIKNVCWEVQYSRSVYSDQAMGRMIWGLIVGRGKNVSSPKMFLTGSGAHPASYLLGNGFFFFPPGVNVWGVKLMAYLLPVPKLKMSVSLPLFILYVGSP